jgi:hypothetical protein
MLGVRLSTPVWIQPRPPRILVDLVDEHFAGHAFEPIAPGVYFHGRVSFRESVNRRFSGSSSLRGVELFVGSADLRDRRMSIVSPINQVPGSGWVALSSQRVENPSGEPAVELLVQRGLERMSTRSWYRGVRGLGEETIRSLFGLEKSAFRRRTGAAVARVAIPVADEPTQESQRQLEDVYRLLEPVMDALHRAEATAAAEESATKRGAQLPAAPR